MKTEFYISRRYLLAKKSHNVINVISAISAAGMALGTAALVIILSVYNGFDSLIRENLSDLDPDVLLCRADGNRFQPSDELLATLGSDSRITSINCIVEDNVFFTYGTRQGVARARGVDFGYETQSGVARHVVEGDFALYEGDLPLAGLGSGLAYSNGIHPRFLQNLELFYPDPSRKVSVMNPSASLNSAKVHPGSIISISADVDVQMMIIPLSVMQTLTGSEDLLSGIEIRLADGGGSSIRDFIRSPGFECGDYVLKDRYAQNPALFKMMKYEKFAIFMILIFMVIIIAFNVFGSLSMLMIEKEEDMESMKAMGATGNMVKKIFLLEGCMISGAGLFIGLLAGISITLLQQATGLIAMPGTSGIAYPVSLQAKDILLICAGVMIIGLSVAATAVVRQGPDASRN